MLEKVLRILGNYDYTVEFRDNLMSGGEQEAYLYRTGNEEPIGKLIYNAARDKSWEVALELLVQCLSNRESELGGENY